MAKFFFIEFLDELGNFEMKKKNFFFKNRQVANLAIWRPPHRQIGDFCLKSIYLLKDDAIRVSVENFESLFPFLKDADL